MGFGVLICVMYLIGAGTLGLAAYHGSVPLRTVAVMLPMFMMAMQVGGVSTGDVTLEQMLAAVPDVDSLVDELAADTPTCERSPSRRRCATTMTRHPQVVDDPLRARVVRLSRAVETGHRRARPLAPRRKLARDRRA